MGLRAPLSASLAIHGAALAMAPVASYVAPVAPRSLAVAFVQAAAPLPTPLRAAPHTPGRGTPPSVAVAGPARLPSGVVGMAAANADASQFVANARPDVPAAATVSPPRYDAAYLDNPAPAYPPAARRRHIEGAVLLDVTVGIDGRPTAVGVAASSGEEQLDSAALAAVRAWRFVPARRGSDPVVGQVRVPLRFHFDG